MKPTRRAVAWAALALALIAAYPLAFPFAAGAWFAWHMNSLAGTGAANCGHVRTGTDPSPAITCLHESVTLRRPFKVAFDLPAADSHAALGIAKSPAGPVVLLRYDSNPGGPCVYLCSPRIVEEPCLRLSVRAEKPSPSTPTWNVQARCEQPTS